ncbi:hypothetical protein [Archangium lansingense]|uniref:Uncharacterized protein n=1 Tax=Archangium lansingense TaxID=2995310 RepID=A0ABT4AHS3_9BACT|nr:hypothetical protein [Archangium lansinium]MCY1080749.1 hypothetical protein [Archangium lansinium]
MMQKTSFLPSSSMMVTSRVTFTGAPNISKGAMTGLNVESALVIDGPQVGYLFKQYHGLLMGDPTK